VKLTPIESENPSCAAGRVGNENQISGGHRATNRAIEAAIRCILRRFDAFVALWQLPIYHCKSLLISELGEVFENRRKVPGTGLEPAQQPCIYSVYRIAAQRAVQ
jgi:hypothetical protein